MMLIFDNVYYIYECLIRSNLYNIYLQLFFYICICLEWLHYHFNYSQKIKAFN